MTAGDSTRISMTTPGNGEMEFWLSDVQQLGANGNKSFTLYGNKNVFLATFAYHSKASARAARQAIAPVLTETVSVATEDS